LSEHTRRAGAAATASEGSGRLNCRILQDEIRILLELFGHGGKGGVLIALNGTVDAPRVLLREKTLGNEPKEVTVETKRANGQQQNRRLMAENEAEAAVVETDDAIEGTFGEAISEIVLAFIMAKETRAHHGCGGERNDHGNRNGRGECDGKFAKEAADNSREKKNGNENGDKRSAHGKNGEADFAGAFHRGGEGFHACFDVARDVFDDDDGVVHDETGGDRQRHEREIVQTVAA